LGIDFGAGTLKVGEFEITEGGALSLKRYAFRPLGLEGSQEAKREAAILRGLQELIASGGFSARAANVCAPGFHVFSKFVKLPPVDASKVTQIIQYEAQQNVPFPLEEVVWDYQILGTTTTGELEVLLVAVKSDIVEGLFRSAEATGLRMQLVDVSPAALCNAFRYNYSDQEGCSMLLDIGAKTSNLLFFEKGKVYSRGINIGANSITQDFATESKARFDDAEQFKIAEGFVSLGGAYEEPENERQAKISKIARQVMTRLHIQVNQTLQFYRGQQGGSAPQRLFLSGGASIMPYTAQFFAEKLNLPVDYFNPLRNVQIDPGVNLEELAKVAHSFGEVVGLALRNLAQCPVELNLMPKSSLKKQQLAQKKPYFIATLASLVLVAVAIGLFSYKLTAGKRAALDELDQRLTEPQQRADTLGQLLANARKQKEEADNLTALVRDKYYWVDLLGALRQAFVETERRTKQQKSLDVGVWIDSFSAGDKPDTAAGWSTQEEEQTPVFKFDERMMARYGMLMMQRYGMRAGGAAEGGEGGGNEDGSKPKAAAATNQIEVVNLTCRGKNLKDVSPSANDELAFDLVRELQSNTNYFVTGGTNGTQVVGRIAVDDSDTNTFTFQVMLRLKSPLKL
jgi:type IV pilus assembly protein PilM